MASIYSSPGSIFVNCESFRRGLTNGSIWYGIDHVRDALVLDQRPSPVQLHYLVCMCLESDVYVKQFGFSFYKLLENTGGL
jgi:hypothetical protein